MNKPQSRVDTFANRLQKAMDIRCIKKAELSRQTGISQQRLGQYALGRYEAKQSAVFTIADVLKVDPTWLMGYDMPMEPTPNKKSRTRKRQVSDSELKIALFGCAEVNDALLENVRNMAKIHFELLKNKSNK